jgi:hypothetical protein
MTTALEGGEWSASRPGRNLPPGKILYYPLYSRLGGPQGRSGQVRKISSPPVFDPRTVQPGSSVAIPTELPGPQKCQCKQFSTYKAACTDACKAHYAIPVYKTVFLKINTLVRDMKKTSLIEILI